MNSGPITGKVLIFTVLDTGNPVIFSDKVEPLILPICKVTVSGSPAGGGLTNIIARYSLVNPSKLWIPVRSRKPPASVVIGAV